MNSCQSSLVAGVAALFCSAAAVRAADPDWSKVANFGFEQDAAGLPPSDFTFAKSESGKAGRWLVKAVPDAPTGRHVLVQTDTDRSQDRFLIAIADLPKVDDVRISVSCKAISGEVDQACGLVFRYQDAGNYYVTRANALEGNVRLYHVRAGRRTQLASWDGAIGSDAWHTLDAETVDDRIRVDFDGKAVISKSDTAFKGAGAVGLWVKADSVTAFDELTIAVPAVDSQ